MRLSIILFTLIYSFDAMSVGLQDFEKYKNNNALLESDISRLEEITKKEKGKIYKDTLDQYKYLLAKYEILNSRLSLRQFSEDAGASGWRNIKRIARNLSVMCEEGKVDYSSCKDGIARLTDFVITSNLYSENKESVIAFLNSYRTEVEVASTFDDSFIARFNQNSEIINREKFDIRKSAAIVVNIKPLKSLNTSVVPPFLPEENKIMGETIAPLKNDANLSSSIREFAQKVVASVIRRVNGTSPKDLVLFVGSICLLIISFFVYYLNQEKRKVKHFQGKVFRIAKNNKMKVKIFGRSSLSGLKEAKNIENKFLDSFGQLKLVTDSAQVKFKRKNNILVVETLYFSKIAAQNYSRKEIFAFQKSIESLQKTVESNEGELVFNSKLNHKGEITQTSYVISLPCV
jgi:hypothetical protein